MQQSYCQVFQNGISHKDAKKNFEIGPFFPIFGNEFPFLGKRCFLSIRTMKKNSHFWEKIPKMGKRCFLAIRTRNIFLKNSLITREALIFALVALTHFQLRLFKI